MSWFVYILECVDGSLYTGIAVDVEARFAAHLAGKGARYTRSRPPKAILARFPYPDRSSASRAEAAIKKLRVGQKRALCTNPVVAGTASPVAARATRPRKKAV